MPRCCSLVFSTSLYGMENIHMKIINLEDAKSIFPWNIN